MLQKTLKLPGSRLLVEGIIVNAQSLAGEVSVSTAIAEIGKMCFQANAESKKGHRYIILLCAKCEFYTLQDLKNVFTEKIKHCNWPMFAT